MIFLLTAGLAYAGTAADYLVEDPAEHGSLLLRTSAPVEIGLLGEWESKGRVRISGGLGFLPPPYLDLVHGVAMAAGWYDQTTADQISAALDSALLLDLGLGWRPLAERGWLLDFGYRVAFLGGRLTSADIVGEEAAGRRDAEWKLHATSHMLVVGTGWEWRLGGHGLLRLGLGGCFTVGATAKVEQVDAIREGGSVPADAIEEVLKRWVHTPTVDLAGGWRFR